MYSCERVRTAFRYGLRGNVSAGRGIFGYYLRKGWLVHHTDISKAFPNEDIDGDIYVEYDGNIYRLLKSLCGLRQSPRLWYEKLTSTLHAFGFEKLPSTGCVYRKECASYVVVIIVYVDDLILISSNDTGMKATKGDLREKSKVEDFGALRHYLGIKFERRGYNMLLTQEEHCERVLDKFDMAATSAEPTPNHARHSRK